MPDDNNNNNNNNKNHDDERNSSWIGNNKESPLQKWNQEQDKKFQLIFQSLKTLIETPDKAHKVQQERQKILAVNLLPSKEMARRRSRHFFLSLRCWGIENVHDLLLFIQHGFPFLINWLDMYVCPTTSLEKIRSEKQDIQGSTTTTATTTLPSTVKYCRSRSRQSLNVFSEDDMNMESSNTSSQMDPDSNDYYF